MEIFNENWTSEYKKHLRKAYVFSMKEAKRNSRRGKGGFLKRELDTIGGQVLVSSVMILIGAGFTLYLVRKFKREEQKTIDWLKPKPKPKQIQ